MNYSRREIKGNNTSLDIKNLNDNFKYLWLKVFGNMDSGTATEVAETTTDFEPIQNKRTVFSSVSAPTSDEGIDGDIWIQYAGGTDTTYTKSTMNKEG